MALLLLILLVACAPKGPSPLALERPEDLTEEALSALVEELAPRVEEAAGRSFASVPHARLGRRADLEGILEAEFRLVVGHVYEEVPPHVQDRLARRARAGAPGVIGKYGVETGVLYLAPEAVAAVAAGAEVPLGDVARLVLAHELAHALQVEVAPWKEDLLPRLRDMDHFDAVRAVTEGHANFVERRVAEQLGLLEAAAALDRSQGWTEDGPLSPESFDLWALYGQGSAFVAHHHAEGGDARVWTLIEAPPASTGMIFRPETYDPRLPEADRLHQALAGVEEALTAGRWVAVSTRAGALRLRGEAFARGLGEGEGLLDAVVDGVTREAFRGERSAILRVLRFEGPEGPQAWLDEIAEAEAPSAGLALEVTPLDDLPVDRALRVVFGPRGGGAASETTEVWMARGRALLLVRAVGFRPGLRLDAAVERLLEQLESAAEDL